jgi:hypothetical protein
MTRRHLPIMPLLKFQETAAAFEKLYVLITGEPCDFERGPKVLLAEIRKKLKSKKSVLNLLNAAD